MVNKKIKLITILLCCMFLAASITTATAISIKKPTNDAQKSKENIRTVTFYRYGPDGTETPFDVKINLDDGNYLDLVSEKCEELISKDTEIQSYFSSLETEDENDTRLNLGIYSKVRSWGKGFHFKFKYKLKFSIVMRILCLALPKIKLSFVRPWVLCNYANDSNAQTKIIPRLHNFTQTSNVTGNHTLLIRNFIGFTTWSGRFDKIQNDRFPEIVWGRALFVITFKH